MTSLETRSTQNTRNKSSSSEQNDLKKLKSKHSAKLPTLKVLFSEWSDDDLLFVLEEANGDLDLAIDRISEGHANQWGEVKTKKSKKEAQKAKAATTTISPHQTSSTITTYSPKSTTPSRTYNDRGSRKAPVPSNRTRKTNSSWEKQESHTTSSIPGGSWASIASSKQQNETNDESWNTSDNWTPTSIPVNDNVNDENDLSNDDQPKTWASLLKSKPKPEAETALADVTENDASATQATTDGWNTTDTANDDSWKAPSSTNTTNNTNTTTTAAVNDSWNGTSVNDDWNTTAEKPIIDEWSTPADVNNTSIVNASNEKESSHEELNKEEEKSFNRLHHQEEPVVLPKSSDIATLDVKFGSLNVEEEPVETLRKESNISTNDTTNIEPVEEPAPSVPSVTNVISNVANASTAAPVSTATTNDPNFVQSSYLKQQEINAAVSNTTTAPTAAASTAPVYQQQQQQQQQQIPQQLPQQLPQQQQPFGMDHLTSAYSSYLPSQPPTGVSGFGMNPMGSLPDYGIYNTEAQRVAAMGYYDPTAFNHSPSVTSASPYQTRDKYNQDSNQTTAQSQNLPQQMYPTNLPYYQYYYMPSQYNAYQQSAYGQPFMNKSMYPNMYQHSTTAGKPTAAAAAAAVQSPYSSPYGQQSQLYTQSMSGYDDLGLSDYQKSMYGQQPQLQGFLGQLNGQQQAGAQVQSAQPSAAKTDITTTATARGATNAAVSQQQQPSAQQQPVQQQSQQQQQQQQQQQAPHQALHQQQHPYAGANNFFGQPQMFSYQQYPQYQQQMTQGHPHQQAQAAASNRHQQQYWNQ
ncbi:hypothetical protein G6F43_006197 [Rhizopus delemar]|nr:hypothetical protein G6F43_006197 [Rhizopus delemar]